MKIKHLLFTHRVFFQATVLVLGAILFLTNCSNDILINQEDEMPNSISLKFKKESMSQVIESDFEVDWLSSTEQYSSELDANYFEFPICIKEGDFIVANHLYELKYSLMAIEKDDEQVAFYVIKYLMDLRKENNPLIQEVSIANTTQFSGLIQVLDKNNEMVYAKKIAEGELVKQKLFLEEDKHAGNGKLIEHCITTTTYHYTDWYVNGVYEDSYLNYITETSVCNGSSDYLPDLSEQGGGGSGLYSSDGGGEYNTCLDTVHGCLYELENKTINLNMDAQGYEGLNSCEKELIRGNYAIGITLQNNANLANAKTQEIFGIYVNGNGHNDCGDAFRHAYFNALNTLSWSASYAKQWGDAHECETPLDLALEKSMDLHNNAIGRSVATQAPNISNEALADLILVELEVGNLHFLFPLDATNNIILGETQEVVAINCL